LNSAGSNLAPQEPEIEPSSSSISSSSKDDAPKKGENEVSIPEVSGTSGKGQDGHNTQDDVPKAVVFYGPEKEVVVHI
jgi:hypothetical protein